MSSESRKQRVHLVDQAQDGEERSPFERDRDRILYSYDFRRLNGVSQVAGVGERHLLHNRMTHSLKVGQVGRRIAQRLLATTPPEKFAALQHAVGATGKRDLGIDPDVVEMAGLAHDLGHPPFGHLAEEALGAKLKGLGGYEGNAQSFRIVTKLSVRKRNLLGLDLSLASLNAIAKYPRLKGLRDGADALPSPWTDRHMFSKSGVYISERDEFERAQSILSSGSRGSRSPEAILVDWADDISYAVHDVEDFFRAGLIPLHAVQMDHDRFLARAVTRLSERKGPSFEHDAFAEAFKKLRNQIIFPNAFEGSLADIADLHRFASDRITEYEKSVRVVDYPPYVEIEPDRQYEALVLMELTWFYVLDRAPLATIQEGQRRVIDKVFETLLAWVTEDGRARVPRRLKDLVKLSQRNEGDQAISATIKDKKRASSYHSHRAVADYVSGLTEPQLYDLYERITGSRSASVFGSWL